MQVAYSPSSKAAVVTIIIQQAVVVIVVVIVIQCHLILDPISIAAQLIPFDKQQIAIITIVVVVTIVRAKRYLV